MMNCFGRGPRWRRRDAIALHVVFGEEMEACHQPPRSPPEACRRKNSVTVLPPVFGTCKYTITPQRIGLGGARGRPHHSQDGDGMCADVLRPAGGGARRGALHLAEVKTSHEVFSRSHCRRNERTGGLESEACRRARLASRRDGQFGRLRDEHTGEP